MNYLQRLQRLFYNVFIHPLTLMVLVAFAVWNILLYFKFSTNVTQDIDQILLAFISFVSFVIVITMIFRTKWHRWTILSSGLLGMFVSTALLYFLSAYVNYIGVEWWRDDLITIVRSLFSISTVWVLIGIIQEWWYEQYLGKASWKDWAFHPIKTFSTKRFTKE